MYGSKFRFKLGFRGSVIHHYTPFSVHNYEMSDAIRLILGEPFINLHEVFEIPLVLLVHLPVHTRD